MKKHPISISTDGSNDTGVHKMNPVTVINFDCKENSVVTSFLDMCITSSSTSHSIFQAINSRLSELVGSSNPWNMCTSVGVDNTSVNIGVRN